MINTHSAVGPINIGGFPGCITRFHSLHNCALARGHPSSSPSLSCAILKCLGSRGLFAVKDRPISPSDLSHRMSRARMSYDQKIRGWAALEFGEATYMAPGAYFVTPRVLNASLPRRARIAGRGE